MKIKRLGTAVFKDLEGYLNWYRDLTNQRYGEIRFFGRYMDNAGNRDCDDSRKAMQNCQSEWFSIFRYNTSIMHGDQDIKFREMVEKNLPLLREFCEFPEKFDQPLSVGIWEEDGAYLYLGNPLKGIYVPEPGKYLDFVAEKDYSHTTIAELRRLSGVSSGHMAQDLIPANAEQSLTQADIMEQVSGCQSELDRLSKEYEDTRQYKVAGLAELKAELDRMEQELYQKKQEMMAELEEKMAEMEDLKENLETQIYMLDSQIYAIRCYTGEVVRFSKIRSGKNAPITEPVVIYQKLRFLDEDLGRLASIYDIQFDELDMFEEFLKYSPLALDNFAPNERCVTLVRLSRTATRIGMDSERPGSNLLTRYDYYHGKTVGIIIRNGENLYLGWTDEDRVHIKDDLIISRVVTEVTPGEAEPVDLSPRAQRERAKKERAEKRVLVDGLISRAFVYNILQGVVDNSDILPLPDGIKLNKQSPYVIYSVADKWLSDSRFGSFKDIIDRVNSRIMEGDRILVTQHLVPEGTRGRWSETRAWENVRGRGEKNRTRDCSVDDCTIYPVNLIEFDEPVHMVKYRHTWKDVLGEEHSAVSCMTERDFERVHDPENCEVLERYEQRDRHLYVSVEKTETWYYGRATEKPARSNFELYDHEYINLTYLNSVWLEWCINNQKLGNWTIKGVHVDYAYGIRYLKKAMDFIRAREKEERGFIESVDPAVVEDTEWPLKLSEWKMEKGVRAMNLYQAKRFVKWLHSAPKKEEEN